MTEALTSGQMRKFVKHLCLVTKHYHDREHAKKDLDFHIHKLSKDPRTHEKISTLIEKESNIRNLGKEKKIPVSVSKKIQRLETELANLKEQKKRLESQNNELKKTISSVTELKDTITQIKDTKDKLSKRTEQIENAIDKKHKERIVKELKDKISGLESSYKELRKDKTIHPARLHKIDQKIQEYKQKLKKL